MSTVKLTIDKRPKKDGSHLINLIIRIGINRFVFSTGVSSPDEASWDDARLLHKSVPLAKVRNIFLQKVKNDAEILLMHEERDIAAMRKEKAKAYLSEKIFQKEVKIREKVFVDYLDEYAGLRLGDSSKRIYESTKNKLLKYDAGCTFNTMDRVWLSNFDKWMEEDGLKINARGLHMRNIRTVFNYGIDEEITTAYPFRKFKIKREETVKRSLSLEQLREVRDRNCSRTDEKYRDIFMLIFYFQGINIGDLLRLTWENVVEGRIEFYRKKTHKLYSMKIEPEAQAIIDKYKGEKHVLNVMDRIKDENKYNELMNKVLKKIIPGMTTYWARHTWATLAHKAGVQKDDISLALGHSFGVNVTDVYIAYDRERIDEANRKVLDFVKGE